ncbi:2-amino-4-hydroxy-6-hydroxymethyldihydropteridine diphosphokinase [Dysgonomonas sp. PH5-45]|uniref:2-amino-4-hydroxy-6- hydroxymethyldihydropteridine diphosphokinase n=1 Tax=unclassified Dysgonomonas TaxID=2630389 RepID=UPI0024741E4D|nr:MULTISPECIES: 2-amino-4-hydroxy-6-hydroxymethyldihydropteridine diphosphokinase [unclassified Dysgonomonas]MDH6353871.1 2-amino-4-hydroxy-6-hydroxymethyldihydropteridine diphosphokinase [Dysgonomonas sp. PH5-45]MDH6386774.1 2-amino-4-hydroxy-6-hydroxymethyldihydropteridine diphosphokinase [Dysgonomonas sp. PH5-37]
MNNIHDVYLGLGTNLGNKPDNIETAVRLLGESVGEVLALSALYETEPEGFVSANNFVNAACLVRTKLSPMELLEVTQQIERQIGRTEKSKNGIHSDRIIDIDILLYGDQTISLPRLTLPHPHLHERGFVILPLADIARDVQHPVLRKTIGELKKEYQTKREDKR